MFELTINNQVYQFNFGMGFLREVNQFATMPVEGIPGAKKNVGLNLMLASILDGEPEALVEALDIANKGQNPRLTKKVLDDYIDSPDVDIDELFETVKGFLSRSNATKKNLESLEEMVEKEKIKQEAAEAKRIAQEMNQIAQEMNQS